MRMGNEIMDMINKCKDTNETEKIATSHQQEEILKKDFEKKREYILEGLIDKPDE